MPHDDQTSLMEAELRSNIFRLFERYRAVVDIAESTLGRAAARNPGFITGLKEGCGFTVATYDRVVQWFSENWPENCNWPEGVRRPASNRKEVGLGQ